MKPIFVERYCDYYTVSLCYLRFCLEGKAEHNMTRHPNEIHWQITVHTSCESKLIQAGSFQITWQCILTQSHKQIETKHLFTHVTPGKVDDVSISCHVASREQRQDTIVYLLNTDCSSSQHVRSIFSTLLSFQLWSQLKLFICLHLLYDLGLRWLGLFNYDCLTKRYEGTGNRWDPILSVPFSPPQIVACIQGFH